jgi:hypothetical protein
MRFGWGRRREGTPGFMSERSLPAGWPWSLPERWRELDAEELADEIVRRNPAAKPLAALLDARIALGQAPETLPRIDAADWDDAQYDRHPLERLD